MCTALPPDQGKTEGPGVQHQRRPAAAGEKPVAAHQAVLQQEHWPSIFIHRQSANAQACAQFCRISEVGGNDYENLSALPLLYTAEYTEDHAVDSMPFHICTLLAARDD